MLPPGVPCQFELARWRIQGPSERLAPAYARESCSLTADMELAGNT